MEIFGITMSIAAIWLVIAVIFGIIEAVTMGLTTIWFSGGAVAAAIVAMFTNSILVQVTVFLAVSIVLLYFTKPLAEKKLKIGIEKTNVDAIIGRKGLVIKEIKPLNPGQVRVGGQEWTAIAEDSKVTIPESIEVTVLRIEGVKLVVTQQED